MSVCDVTNYSFISVHIDYGLCDIDKNAFMCRGYSLCVYHAECM